MAQQRNLSIPLEEVQSRVDRDGERLDHYLARVYPWRSRTRYQQMISDGLVTVNGSSVRRHRRLKRNDEVVVAVDPEPLPDYQALLPEILYEDAAVVLFNKPAALAVHPISKAPYHNLLSVIHHHYRHEEYLPQLIHRLDIDTTGVILAARTNAVLNDLRNQFYQRRVKKVYLAVTVPGAGSETPGTIDAPIAAAADNETVSRIDSAGKAAVSRYCRLAGDDACCLYAVAPLTGRQHQVRIHLAHLGFPLLGDTRYGGPVGRLGFRRPALHAYQLTVTHPVRGEPLAVTAPLPPDFVPVVERLGMTAAAIAVRIPVLHARWETDDA